MGLRDDIATLEARLEAGREVGQELAEAYAEMISRKNSKRLIMSWYDDLANLLNSLDRYRELVEAADGVDPDKLGAWDVQAAVSKWLAAQTT